MQFYYGLCSILGVVWYILYSILLNEFTYFVNMLQELYRAPLFLVEFKERQFKKRYPPASEAGYGPTQSSP
jgi:hypothetical protein